MAVQSQEKKTLFTILDEIRSKEHSSYDLTLILKEISQDYDESLLKSIYSDIDLYLFIEKEEYEGNIDPHEIDKKIESYESQGISIPYIQSNFHNLTDGQKEKQKLIGHVSKDILNVESLMYPFEFFSVYQFRNIIRNKLGIETPLKPPHIVLKRSGKLKWTGSQTEFVELVKALVENGTVVGIQKNIINELSNVFNFPINNPDKIINDIKNRNNGSETLFLDNLKTSLFNYLKR